MKTDFDLLIVGGGMVGASLACAVQHLPLRVGLIEASAPDATHPSFDARAIALSQGSKRILDTLGVWQALEHEGATAIRRIHVSDRGHYASARLSAEEEGVEALGYVAEAAAMGRAFDAALGAVSNLEWLRPAQVAEVSVGSDHARLRLHTAGGERSLTTRLLVAADGGRSFIREQLGEKSVRLAYGQTAIIAYVVTDVPHDFVAYERFTETGPLAMLPCGTGATGAHRWSLVWTARDEEVDEILALSDDEFLARLQARLGYRAGRVIGTGPRFAYPLALHYLRDFARPRVVFVGNAAHTIHPVGGQGYNLGLRDVAALAEVLAEAVRSGGDVGGSAVIDAYVAWRKPDYARVLALTDGMARTFSSALRPLVSARNLGLLGIDLLPQAKHLFARQFMGLTGKQPRLARGLRLTA
jgi:2-octaprenyl-6-methoxyphenol hydroxylase